MQVILKTLSLNNFRNIENKTYNFEGNRIAIAGKNRIGKSNTIQAIHWLLTDKLIDGSSDAASIKPLDDTSKKVEVKAVFIVDGKEFEVVKSYYENWAKNRGTGEYSLTGNITEYSINGIEMKVGNALEKIRQTLGLDDVRFANGNKIDSTINLISALINPLYMCEQMNEKDLRSFIIGLIGDVSDADVFEKDFRTKGAKDTLDRYSGDTLLAEKFLKNQIKELSTAIDMHNNFIKELQKESDVDTIELQDANREVARITCAIENVKASRLVENSKITKLKESIEQIEQEQKLLIDKLNKEVNEFNSIVNTNISALMEKKALLLGGKERIQQAVFAHQNKISNLNSTIKNLELTLEFKNKEINLLREKAIKVANSEYQSHENNCPNCGFTLNQEQINKERSDFENTKEEELATVNRQGKALKLEIENIKLKIEKSKEELSQCEQEKIADSSNYESAIEEINQKIQEEKSKHKVADIYSNADYLSLVDTKREKEAIIAQLKQDETNSSIESQIAEYESSMCEYKAIIAKHEVFLAGQNKIDQYKLENRLKINELNTLEEKLIAVELFEKTRLKMLDEKISAVFGDIKIQLIQKNIKKDSWDSVCKPLVKNKNTLFENGSTSEKIITGIAFIECVKHALKLSDLPILFDEGEALDKETINDLITPSQIICAVVNDNYNEPTTIVLD